jgi:hypothetical protein
MYAAGCEVRGATQPLPAPAESWRERMGNATVSASIGHRPQVSPALPPHYPSHPNYPKTTHPPKRR